MTTRAREVEAWLRKEETDCREAADNSMAGSKRAKQYELEAALWKSRASALSALIAECETAKAELAEAVKVMDRLIDEEPRDGAGLLRELWVYEIDLTATRAFIAKRAPTPELITGEVGREIPGEETNK